MGPQSEGCGNQARRVAEVVAVAGAVIGAAVTAWRSRCRSRCRRQGGGGEGWRLDDRNPVDKRPKPAGQGEVGEGTTPKIPARSSSSNLPPPAAIISQSGPRAGHVRVYPVD
jgi:hypothetical protein